MSDAFFRLLNGMNSNIKRARISQLALVYFDHLMIVGAWTPAQFDDVQITFQMINETKDENRFVEHSLNIVMDFNKDYWWEPSTALLRCAEHLSRSNIKYSLEELGIYSNVIDGADPYHGQGMARIAEIFSEIR